MKKLITLLLLSCTLLVSAQITIAPTTADTGYCQNNYAEKITASGGVAPYQYTITSGSLPSGVYLNKKNGNLTGIIQATSATTATYTVKATDAVGTTATRSYTMVVVNKQPTWQDNVTAFGSMPNTYPTYAQSYNAYRQSVNNLMYAPTSSRIVVPYSDTIGTPNYNSYIKYGTSTTPSMTLKAYTGTKIAQVTMDSSKVTVLGKDSLNLKATKIILYFNALPVEADTAGLPKGTLYRGTAGAVKIKF